MNPSKIPQSGIYRIKYQFSPDQRSKRPQPGVYRIKYQLSPAQISAKLQSNRRPKIRTRLTGL